MKTSRSYLAFWMGLGLVACHGAGDDTGRSDLAVTDASPSLTVTVNGADAPLDDAAPTATMLGDRIAFRVTGLAAGERVTLRASARGFGSSAAFRASPSGVIDTATDAPESGSYAGADADGLFWSMVASPTDPTAASPDPTRLDVTAETSSGVLTAHLRPGFGSGVAFTRVDEGGLRGVLARPSGGEHHGAVVVLHGSEGNTSSSGVLAGFLASKGYVAFAPAWFGQPGQPEFIERVPLEYFGKAIDWVKTQPGVDADRVAIVGTSRGGEAALLAGSYFDVKGVVGIVPSGVALAGNPGESSWTFGGADVPFLEPNLADVATVTLPDGRTAQRQSAMYPPALADADKAAHAEIPVERTHGPLLLLGGADDAVWPSCTLGKIALDRLHRLGHPYADELVCYPDTGHAVGLAGMPTTDLVLEHPILHELFMLGGTPAGTAHAQRDATNRIVKFLADALR
jgi:dienelactone hydrolase